MGPSGGGKTSLLTALAGGSRDGRSASQLKVSGTLKLNGEPHELGSLVSERLASYVTQEDCLQPALTVHETLLFGAELQLPASPQVAREIRVGEVMRDLRLQHRADSRVSTLSGGERRRLSIGCDGMLHAPLLMFLDEPTSGLSSTDALDVCTCLHTLADESNFTIIMTIHQPAIEVRQNTRNHQHHNLIPEDTPDRLLVF